MGIKTDKSFMICFFYLRSFTQLIYMEQEKARLVHNFKNNINGSDS
jgi:hypothetical protein